MSTLSSRQYIIESPFFKICDTEINYIKDYTKDIHSKSHSEKSNEQIESYFNDVYHIFLNRLTTFAQEGETKLADYKRLESLFAELISTKKIMESKE